MRSNSPAGSRSNQAITSWISCIQAGLIAGLMATFSSISYASLITGATAPDATAAIIGMALIGGATLCFLLGAFSNIKGVIPHVQDVPSVALGAIVVTLVANRTTIGGDSQVAEIVVLCLVAGGAFALSLYVFGALGLADLMRYAPRPVVAGFLAGTGYFVIVGALGVCLGEKVTLETLPGLLDGPARNKTLVAVAVALVITAASRRVPTNIAIGTTLGLSLALFHAAPLLIDIDPAELVATGWFVTLPDGGLPWPPVPFGELRALDKGFLAGEALPLCTMIVLSTAALLMNTSVLEVKTRSNLGLNRELKVLGLSNLAAAGLGGLPGYHGVATTMTAFRIAPAHRAVSFMAGGMALFVFATGNTVLAFLPLPIFAGFILWIGVDFLREWLFHEVRVTPIGEAWLTVAIFAVIAVFGLFEGTLFGLVAGGMLFIVDYSRLDPVRRELSGDAYHGSTEMTEAELRILEEHGGCIVVLKLQGYVFFGTAHRLRDRVRALTQTRPLRYLVLDFADVTGIDATAVGSLQLIADDLEPGHHHVTLTGMSPKVAGVVRRAGVDLDERAMLATAGDLNTGLSAYESRLLAKFLPDMGGRPTDIHAMLADILPDDALRSALVPYLEREEAEAGTILIREGEVASDIFFLERGRVDVRVGRSTPPRQVRTLHPGAIFGEISAYRRGIRTSTVQAETPVALWRFSRAAAERVLADAPELSSHFHAGMACILAERVSANTRLIQILRA